MNFNPRSLAGATKANEWAIRCVHISIHAPSRERPTFTGHLLHILVFQSTLPRGSDDSQISLNAASANFNPRSLAGATFYCLAGGRHGLLFQSTLPRGSDREQPTNSGLMPSISIHAPSRERHYHSYNNGYYGRFQSTLPRGSDRALSNVTAPTVLFQSTLPRGSDP